MREYLCMDCDYLWFDLDQCGCPKCTSPDVIDCGESGAPSMAPDLDWDEAGHFEGDFTNHSYVLSETGE